MSRVSGKSKASRHAQQGSKTEQLADRLKEWATECAYNHSDGLPSTEELKTLLRGSNSNAWRHITEHVHHPSHVKLVRKNLVLTTGPGRTSAERAGLIRERAELQRELNSLKLAVGQLDMDFSRVQTDISTIDVANTVARAEVVELERKRALLSAHSVKAAEMAGFTAELTHRIAHRSEPFRRKPMEATYFACPESHSRSGPRNVVLESACKRRVGQVCLGDVEELLRLLSSSSLANSSNQRSEDVERLRQQTWTKVEGLLAGFPPAELLSSMAELALQGGRKLQEDTAAINLARDAHKLRYHYEQGKGMQEVDRTSLLQTVEDHLMEAQLAHIKRSVEVEQRHKAALAAQNKLAEVKGQIDRLLTAQYRQDHEGLEMARRSVLLGLEVSGLAGSLPGLAGACRDLQDARTQRRQSQAVLQDKLQRINQFTATSEERQREIQALVKLNSAARSSLLKQRTEVEAYVRESVCGHEAELVGLAGGLLDSVGSEVKLLSSALSLARALTPPGESTAQCDLSISRLRPLQPSGAPSWSLLSGRLKLAPSSAPEALLPLLLELLDRAACLEREGAEAGRSLELKKRQSQAQDKLEEVLSRSRHCNARQLCEGVPAAQQCLSQASQALAHCSVVEQTLKEWWDEPGKLCVPWVSYEGMSVAKWTDQWRVLTAQLRQLTETS